MNFNILGDKPDFIAYTAGGKISKPPKAMRKPSGHIVVNDQVVADTAQCVNCGNHFIMVKGSGRVRGYCTHCQGYLCGINCIPCTHWVRRQHDGF